MREMMFGSGRREQYIITELRRQPRKQLSSVRKFDSFKPGSVSVAQQATAITGGFQFKFYLLGGKISGYRIYRSLINNANVADMVDFIPQPPSFASITAFTWQETTSDTPYYWVAAVNEVGKEGDRIAMTGAPAPTPAPEVPAFPDPGSGSGGGRGGFEGGIALE